MAGAIRVFHSQPGTPAVISVNSFVRASASPHFCRPRMQKGALARRARANALRRPLTLPRLVARPASWRRPGKHETTVQKQKALFCLYSGAFGACLVTLKRAASFSFSSAASFSLFTSNFNLSLASRRRLVEKTRREMCMPRQKGLDGYYLHQEPLVNMGDKHPAMR